MYHSTNGYYYMGAAQQTVQRSLNLKTWKALPNTPTTVSNAIIGDGHRIFAAARAFEMYTASPERTERHGRPSRRRAARAARRCSRTIR